MLRRYLEHAHVNLSRSKNFEPYHAQGQSYIKVLDPQAVGCFFRGANFWIGIKLPKRILKRRKRATTLYM
jgi:hypothetical protein